MRPFTLVAVVFLAIIAFAHLLRVLLGIGILIGRMLVPSWMSLVAAIAIGALAVQLWREQQPHR